MIQFNWTEIKLKRILKKKDVNPFRSFTEHAVISELQNYPPKLGTRYYFRKRGMGTWEKTNPKSAEMQNNHQRSKIYNKSYT